MAGRLSNPGTFKAALRDERQKLLTNDTNKERFFSQLEDTATIRQAMDRLTVHQSFFTLESTLRQFERADWQHVEPRLMRFTALLIEAFRRQGIPLYPHSAFRTSEEQRELVRKGVSKTPPPIAAHCQGCAVDIVHGRYHWELSRNEWAAIGKIGKMVAQSMGLDVTWGGDWSFYDPAHWEIKGWRDLVAPRPLKEPIRKTPRKILSEYK